MQHTNTAAQQPTNATTHQHTNMLHINTQVPGTPTPKTHQHNNTSMHQCSPAQQHDNKATQQCKNTQVHQHTIATLYNYTNTPAHQHNSMPMRRHTITFVIWQQSIDSQLTCMQLCEPMVIWGRLHTCRHWCIVRKHISQIIRGYCGMRRKYHSTQVSHIEFMIEIVWFPKVLIFFFRNCRKPENLSLASQVKLS